MVFDRAWTVAPLTLPAHATYLTGLLPPQHGLRLNEPDAALPASADREFLTLAEAFRREVLAPKLARSTAVFERAKARGEIREDVDISLLAPALAGIVLHRFFLVGEAPTPDLVARVIDQIILPAATAAGSQPTDPTQRDHA